MPNKALVAFGIVLTLGVLIMTAPAISIAAENAELMISPDQATIPQNDKEQITPSTGSAIALTLDDALTRSIKQNLQLAAFSREVEARQFEAQQAGFFLNPEFSVEVENFAGSGAYSGTNSAETTLMLRQQFELGGKGSKRQQIGKLEKELAEQGYLAARAEIIAVTTDRYLAVLTAQQRLVLADEQIDLASKVLATVEQRIDAGKSARIEKVRFQTLLVEAQLHQRQSRQELVTARQALASLWGQDSVDFTTTAEYLELLRPVPTIEELTPKLLQSPTFGYQKIAVRKAEQNLLLAQAQGIPDLTLNLGIKNFEESNDNALVAGFSIALPIFDRNQGAIGAAQARQEKVRDQARATQFELQAELNGTWQRLQATYAEALMLRNQVLPAVQQNFDAITYGYQAGKFGFLEVLDAEQTLFESKARYLESLSNYHQTYAELERLLGQKLSTESNAPAAAADKQRGLS